MNLFRSTALLLFVATSATAQRDTIDEDNGYIKFLRQVHGEKSHDDHQHLLMDHANVKAPDLKDSLGKFSRFIEIEEASFFENLVRNISSDQLVVIEVVGRDLISVRAQEVFEGLSNDYPYPFFGSINLSTVSDFKHWPDAPTFTELPSYLFYRDGEMKKEVVMGDGDFHDLYYKLDAYIFKYSW
mmetsp:Transcript_5571/g.8142  ORF Transcript_5571/g.8142 Transcript_5571/m.8142 type:complete len:185 (-) Transcript_5571:179-733(-)